MNSLRITKEEKAELKRLLKNEIIVIQDFKKRFPQYNTREEKQITLLNKINRISVV